MLEECTLYVCVYDKYELLLIIQVMKKKTDSSNFAQVMDSIS